MLIQNRANGFGNAMKYGFIIVSEGYEDVTVMNRCWHCYIGVEACKMQQKWFGNIQQYMLGLYAEKANVVKTATLEN